MVDPFASLWDRATKVLDRGVDSVVGDRLYYRHGGVWLGTVPKGSLPGARPVVEGFALIAGERSVEGYEPIDETLASRPRVKISRALVDEPLQSDRIQHPKLGEGWFRPAGSQPETDGRYWVFDVQEASAP